MRSDDIAADIRPQRPTGERDLGMRVGVVLSWDDSTASNQVDIEGTVFQDLNVVQSGIGIQYQPGDVVVVMRSKTTYFIWGKVAAPGAGAAQQIQSDRVDSFESTASTAYVDLATFGPSVTVNIGSSRRCLIIASCFVTVFGNAANTLIGGSFTCSITGASTIPDVSGGGAAWLAQSTLAWGGADTSTSSALVTAALGLNKGSNTFTMKYKSRIASPAANFNARQLTVIPF